VLAQWLDLRQHGLRLARSSVSVLRCEQGRSQLSSRDAAASTCSWHRRADRRARAAMQLGVRVRWHRLRQPVGLRAPTRRPLLLPRLPSPASRLPSPTPASPVSLEPASDFPVSALPPSSLRFSRLPSANRPQVLPSPALQPQILATPYVRSCAEASSLCAARMAGGCRSDRALHRHMHHS
jgi:hypothetical protein